MSKAKTRARFDHETNGRRTAVLWAIGAAPSHKQPGGLTGTERLVLCMIERFVGWEQRNTGECWPSVPSIAAACDIDERTVYRALVSAEAKGWLHVRRRTTAGATVTSVYRVTPPSAVAAAEPVDEPPVH